MKTYEPVPGGEAWRPSRPELSGFLREQVLTTLSTLDSDGAPESATVAFSETDDGAFLIGTSEASRKVRNIEGDARVAMTVTDAERRYTAQIKGTAEKLSEVAFAALADEHYRQRPESLPFRDDASQVHVLVTPSEIRFSDVSVNPWVVTEY